MRNKLILAPLLLSISSPALAQTAPDVAAPTRRAPARAAVAQPAPSSENKLPVLARQGLTQNPVDVGRLQLGTGEGGFVSNGGATARAPGGGQIIEEDAPKARSTVTRDGIEKLPPAANPYQIIELAPGANVASTDALGLNGGNISIRGFNSDQIGVTVEGAPVNDSGNFAVFPQEYVDAPNIGQVSLAQGTPDLDSPHIGATGGVLNVYARDPSKTFGAFASQTLGTRNATYSFGRIDTGQIGNFRGFVSYSHYERNHFTGPGADNRNHIDVKAVYDNDAKNKISFSAIYNEAVNNFYLNPTHAQFLARTKFTDFLPTTAITGPNQNANNANQFYRYRINPFQNLILSAPSSFSLTDKLTYDVVPYFWYGYGSGGGVSALQNGNAAFGNARLTDAFNANRAITTSLFYSPSTTETNRPGIVNKLTYQLGDHKLVAGYWFEYAQHQQTAPYVPLGTNGQIVEPFATNRDGITIQNGPFAGRTLQRRDTETITLTNVIFAGDTWSLYNDRLSIEAGVKQAFVRREVTNRLPGSNNYLLNDSATLPQGGIRYNINKENQIFVGVGTTFRTPPNFTLVDTFNLNTGALTTRGNINTRPEEAVTIDFGHRYQSDIFVTSLTFFGTKYANRQVQTSVPDGGAFVTTSINAGNVTQYGIDAEIGTKPLWGGWTAYISGEILNSRIEDNLRVGNDFLRTRGRQLPRAPNHQEGVRLAYDDTHFYASLSGKYVGRQYSTFLNDDKIKGFGRLDAVIGYRFADFAGVKKPELKINFHNLLDRRTLTGVQSVQTNAFASRGLNGTNIAGSSPLFYQGEGFAAFVTFSGAL